MTTETNTPGQEIISCTMRTNQTIETAKANDLNPASYLKYIFEKLPLCQSAADYEALLPWHVKTAL